MYALFLTDLTDRARTCHGGREARGAQVELVVQLTFVLIPPIRRDVRHCSAFD